MSDLGRTCMTAKQIDYLTGVQEPLVDIAPSIAIIEVEHTNAHRTSHVLQVFLNFMQGIDGGSKKPADTKQYVHSVAQVIKHVGSYDKLDIDSARPYYKNLRDIVAVKFKSNVHSKSLSGLTVRAYLYNLDHFNRCPVVENSITCRK